MSAKKYNIRNKGSLILIGCLSIVVVLLLVKISQLNTDIWITGVFNAPQDTHTNGSYVAVFSREDQYYMKDALGAIEDQGTYVNINNTTVLLTSEVHKTQTLIVLHDGGFYFLIDGSANFFKKNGNTPYTVSGPPVTDEPKPQTYERERDHDWDLEI